MNAWRNDWKNILISDHTLPVAYLFWMVELSPESGIHSKCCLLWMTGNSLDIHLHITFQQLVDLTVVIIIIPAHTQYPCNESECISSLFYKTFTTVNFKTDHVATTPAAKNLSGFRCWGVVLSLIWDWPDAIYAVYIVPESFPEGGGVHICVHGHGVICQCVHHLELLIQQLSHLSIQPVHEREAMVLPRVVLNMNIY